MQNSKIHKLNLEFVILFCNFANRLIIANSIVMEENFATRLKLFMDSIDVASSQFADSCEIPRPSFSQLLSGRNQKVSDVLISKIHSAYPQLSIMWLMFGEGKMLADESSDDSSESSSESPDNDTAKNLHNLQENPSNPPANSGYSNLKGLTPTQNPTQSSIFQQLEDNKKIVELQMQIEKLQKNPRRVAQITVYYDDSTFETFIPSK